MQGSTGERGYPGCTGPKVSQCLSVRLLSFICIKCVQGEPGHAAVVYRVDGTTKTHGIFLKDKGKGERGLNGSKGQIIFLVCKYCIMPCMLLKGEKGRIGFPGVKGIVGNEGEFGDKGEKGETGAMVVGKRFCLSS